MINQPDGAALLDVAQHTLMDDLLPSLSMVLTRRKFAISHPTHLMG
ncbi:MAG: hypothetical protein ACREPL_03845 [Rhodanobacteraceae bacterium]